jgi:hypothetical protein
VTDNNLHVTAPAPLPYPRLVAVVRGGFADEVSRKVRDLLCGDHSDPPCERCATVADVLLILKEYR